MMAIAHILQFELLPSQRTAWLAAAKQIKSSAARHGATARWYSPVVGRSPNVIARVTRFADLPAFAAFTEAMRNDRDMQKAMDALRSIPIAVLSSAINRDITDEIDSLKTPEPGAPVANVVQLQIPPGSRQAWLQSSKELRAIANKHGMTLARWSEPVVGGVSGTVTGAWGYESLEAWAKERQKGADSGFASAVNQFMAGQKGALPVTVNAVLLREITDV
jgi:hypothetical protein